MFDHCDANTMAIVDAAFAEARQLGHNYLGTEHVVVAISYNRTLLPPLVADLLPSADHLRAARMAAEIGAPAPRDADLLRAVGVDLNEVRAAVRRTFGDDAVDEIRRRWVHQPWHPGRRPLRRCTSMLAGFMGMAPRLKLAFECARRRADGAGVFIDPSGLLLAMIDVEDAMSNQLLIDSGVDLAALRQRLAG